MDVSAAPEPPSASVVDVLDRVLDKGIVIDQRAHVSLVGVHVITIHAHVVVASFDTHLRYWNADALRPPGH